MKKIFLIAVVSVFCVTAQQQTFNTNVLDGPNNIVYFGQDNQVHGRDNQISGYQNQIHGNQNNLQGDQNHVRGHGNNISGTGNIVSGGSGNIVQGQGNMILGSDASQEQKQAMMRRIQQMFNTQRHLQRNEQVNNLSR